MSLQYLNNLEDYGFYQVGQSRYYNKIQAIMASHTSKQPLHWNYLDDEFDRYTWSQEPEQTLEELYAQRAQDLRQRYDYLVLHFSGGSDSTNILETFIRNNIHLDEIVTRGSYSQAQQRQGVVAAHDIYGECLGQGIPLAQYVRDNHMPHVKITLVETSQIIHDYYAHNPDWVEQANGVLTPGVVVKSNIDNLSPHYRELNDRGLRVAHIYGADKPNIHRHGEIFYTQWSDHHVNYFNLVRTIASDLPQYIECFYWGRNAVQLQIKQLHVLKQHIKQHQIPDHQFDLAKARGTGRPLAQVGRDVENYLASVIYHRTLPLYTQHLKDNSPIIVKEQDSWFMKDAHSDAFRNYQRGIEYLGTILPQNWLCNGDIWHGYGLNPCRSRTRYLGV